MRGQGGGQRCASVSLKAGMVRVDVAGLELHFSLCPISNVDSCTILGDVVVDSTPVEGHDGTFFDVDASSVASTDGCVVEYVALREDDISSLDVGTRASIVTHQGCKPFCHV